MTTIGRHAPDLDTYKHAILSSTSRSGQNQARNGTIFSAKASFQNEQDRKRIPDTTIDKRKRRKRSEGAVAGMCRWIVEHQTGTITFGGLAIQMG